MRIPAGMIQPPLQLADRGLPEDVLDLLRVVVDMVGREVRRPRQVEFPEPVVAHDFPGAPPSFGREGKEVTLKARQTVAVQFGAEGPDLLHGLAPPRRQLLQRDRGMRETVALRDVVHRLQGILAPGLPDPGALTPQPDQPSLPCPEEHRAAENRARHEDDEGAGRKSRTEEREKRPPQARRRSQQRRVHQQARQPPGQEVRRRGRGHEEGGHQHDPNRLERDHHRRREQEHERVVHEGRRQAEGAGEGGVEPGLGGGAEDYSEGGRDRAGAAWLAASAWALDGAEPVQDRAGIAARVAAADSFVHLQDLPETDLLLAADYAAHEAGFAAARAMTGGQAALYHLDVTDPARPRARTLPEEIARVVHARAAHPGWIAGMRAHGFRGAAEIAATLEHMAAFAHLAGAVGPHLFDLFHDATLGDAETDRFLRDANPGAHAAMVARFAALDAAGLWQTRRNSIRARMGAGA